jgi:hypothetical protein
MGVGYIAVLWMEELALHCIGRMISTSSSLTAGARVDTL